MSNTEIESNKVVDVTSASTVSITPESTELVITVPEHPVIEINTNQYVIANGGMAGFAGSGNVPTWLGTAIDNAIANGLVDTGALLSDLRTYVDNVESGVNQSIINLQNEDGILNGLVTTNKTETDNALAAVVQANNTKITEDDASTLITNAITSEFTGTGGTTAQAWFTNVHNTYASEIAANSSSLSVLNSTITDPNTGVTATASLVDQMYTSTGIDPETGQLTAGAGYLNELTAAVGNIEDVALTSQGGVFVGTHIWDGVEDLKIGYLKFVGDVQYQYLGGALGESSDGWVRTDKSASDEVAALDTSVQDLINVTISDIQDQIDGVIDTWFEDYVPDVTVEPWLTWSTTDTTNGNTVEQDKHTGDLFYNTATGAGYRFTKVGEVFSWGVITDTAITTALANAATAQDTADGKRRVFTATPTIPYDIGDLWTQGSSGDLLRCKIAKADNETYSITDWELASKYTDDTAVTTLNTGLGNGTVAINLTSATLDGSKSIQTYVTEEIDKEVVVYSGADHTLQTGMKTNDIYIEKTVDTSGAVDIDVLNTYTYNGASWDIIGNNNNLTALADLADGKRTIYSNASDDVPVGVINDVWIPTTGLDDLTYIPGEIYQFTTVWELATRYTEDLDLFVSEVNETIVPALESQIDNKLEYYFQASTDITPYDTTGFPIGTFSVANRPARNGDVIYFTDLKTSFRYVSASNTWTAITDADALQALQDAATSQAAADRKMLSFYAGNATPPTADGVGDLWVVSDLYYDSPYDTRKIVKRWDGTGWVTLNESTDRDVSHGWAGGASKLITDPTSGAVTGWSFGDGSSVNSEFKIQADNFVISSADGSHQPFEIDTVSGESIFRGKVTFTSGGSTTTGTINEAITANIEQVTVGDKNINITDNLIPTTSLVSDVNNAGYQFVGDPIKSSAAGLDTFSEPQIVLDANDEVYSPYVDELTAAYYYRFGIYGVANLSSFGVHTIDAVDAVTKTNLTYNMLDGNTIAAGTWHIVDGIINPNGGDATSYSGSIRTADGAKIGEVQNIAMPADAEQLVLGWQYDATISRPKLAKITADTLTGSFATTDYVNTEFPNYSKLLDPNLSLIDGGTIVAGSSITSPVINAGIVNGSEIYGGTIEGTLITGAIIRASYIDYTSVQSLTNWPDVTDINTIPVQYWDNFAQDENNVPIVDINGSYRLFTESPLYITPVTSSLGQTAIYETNSYTYDYYQILGRKLITPDTLIQPYSTFTLASGGIYFEGGSGDKLEYVGGGYVAEVSIMGHVLRMEGYAESTYYNNSSPNYTYIRIFLNGVQQHLHVCPGANRPNEHQYLSGTNVYTIAGFTVNLAYNLANLGEKYYPGQFWPANYCTSTFSISIDGAVGSTVHSPKTGYSGTLFKFNNVDKASITYTGQSWLNRNPYNLSYHLPQLELGQYYP